MRFSVKEKGRLQQALALVRDPTFYSSSKVRLARRGRRLVKRAWRRWMKRQAQAHIEEQLEEL